MNTDDTHLLERALASEPQAVRMLVDRLTPVIHVRVGRVLARRQAGALGRDLRQEVEDLVQEVFTALFERQGRLLRGWSNDKGLSLPNYVGLIAERRAINVLVSRKKSPWTERPMAADDLGRALGSTPGHEARASESDLLRAVLDRMKAELSPHGLRLFELLMLEQRDVAEVAAATDMTPAAIYAWRSRLAKRARAIRDGLLAEPAPSAVGGSR